MTQLELPPISFARYFDLLKRRRWQVVPISILGLIIGAVVAFFIPRYYVCQTVVEFSSSVLTPSPGQDPMRRIVGAAEVSIQYAVDEAVTKLGWPEATTGPLDSRRAFKASVRDEVRVSDFGSKAAGRRTANVRIVYRDTDPIRAKELCDTLRDVWIIGQTDRLKEKADQELKEVKRRMGNAMTVKKNADQDKVQFEKNNRINPQDPPKTQQSVKSEALRGINTEIQNREFRRAGLLARIEAQKKVIANTLPTKLVQKESELPQAVQQQIQKNVQAITILTAKLSGITPSHPDYVRTEKQIAALSEEIEALGGSNIAGQQIEQPNEQYVKLQNALEKDQIDLNGLEAELVEYKKRKDVLMEELSRLPQLMASYADKKRALTTAIKTVDALDTEYKSKQQAKLRLIESEPYRVLEWAKVPPRPTEPNIYILALAGSAVGLALAIGLILVIDILQTTFKTVEDVERLLPVPVLGGMSHMVTMEQRRQVTARRTRMGLVSGVFLVLMIAVITIYYVAPTRLPPVVRDTLGLILGTPSAASPR